MRWTEGEGGGLYSPHHMLGALLAKASTSHELVLGVTYSPQMFRPLTPGRLWAMYKVSLLGDSTLPSLATADPVPKIFHASFPFRMEP